MFPSQPRLYRLAYHSPRGDGSAVAVRLGESIVGGDSWFCFRGKISEAGDDIEVEFQAWKNATGFECFFVNDQNHLLLHGRREGPGFSLRDSTGAFDVTLREILE